MLFRLRPAKPALAEDPAPYDGCCEKSPKMRPPLGGNDGTELLGVTGEEDCEKKSGYSDSWPSMADAAAAGGGSGGGGGVGEGVDVAAASGTEWVVGRDSGCGGGVGDRRMRRKGWGRQGWGYLCPGGLLVTFRRGLGY